MLLFSFTLLSFCGFVTLQQVLDRNHDFQTPGGNVCTYTFIVPQGQAQQRCENTSSLELQNKLTRVENILYNVRSAINRQNSARYPQDCEHAYILNGDTLVEGVHLIQPTDYPEPFPVYCQVTDTGVWTVIQRRQDGSVNFFNEWETYKYGFGYITGEHWLGNEKIHYLVRGSKYKLQIDLEDWTETTKYAKYDAFQIGSEATKYLLILGKYSGNAGDSLGYHNLLKFSAKDQDNDGISSYCCACTSGSKRYGRGGWWYKSCHQANLNGIYHSQTSTYSTSYQYGIEWYAWHAHRVSLKKTLMKVQRAQSCWL